MHAEIYSLRKRVDSNGRHVLLSLNLMLHIRYADRETGFFARRSRSHVYRKSTAGTYHDMSTLTSSSVIPGMSRAGRVLYHHRRIALVVAARFRW